MVVSDALTKISYALRGIDDDAPSFGDDEAIYWLSVLNSKKDEYAQDIKQRWADLFEVRTLADAVASGTQAYDLPDDFLAPSDEVYIDDLNGQRTYYEFVKPQQRSRYGVAEVFVQGNNPKQLVFTRDIDATSQVVGGSILVPGYYRPADMTTANSVLPFSDPNWALMATAAEIAFNDVVYETKAADLTEKANDLYRKMAQANRALTYRNGRRVPYNTSNFKITSPDRRR